jgi:hypothetical protein
LGQIWFHFLTPIAWVSAATLFTIYITDSVPHSTYFNPEEECIMLLRNITKCSGDFAITVKWWKSAKINTLKSFKSVILYHAGNLHV